MQTAASSPSEAIIFELAATVSEMLMADVLLQGDTPLDFLVDLVRGCRAMCCRKQKIRVRPINSGTTTIATGDAAGPAEPSVLDVSLHVGTKGAEAVEAIRAHREFKRKFLTNSIMMLGIMEACSIFITTAFSKIYGINFGPAGSPKVTDFLLFFNLAVMVFGEVVLTDGIVAYLSSIWKDRYIIDISAEYEKRDVFMLRCFYIYIAFGTFTNFVGVTWNMCYTSYVGEENFLDLRY